MRQLQLLVLLSVLLSLFNIVLLWFDMIVTNHIKPQHLLSVLLSLFNIVLLWFDMIVTNHIKPQQNNIEQRQQHRK